MSRERIEEIRDRVTISMVSNLRPSGYQTCIACNGIQKLGVYQDKFCQCFRPGCELHERRDVFGLYQYLNDVNFAVALKELAQMAGLEASGSLYQERSQVLGIALNCYQEVLWSSEGTQALEYLRARGFSRYTIERSGVGFAAPGARTLREYHPTEMRFYDHGLIYQAREFFSNRIIFPIYRGQSLVHLTGRYLGDIPLDKEGQPLCGRYKNTATWQGINSKDSLFMEQELENASRELLILTEGQPDTMSVMQCGLQGVGLLGLTGLVSHAEKLKRFHKIVVAFDSDVHDDGPLKGEYKSWSVVLPQLMDLQCLIPQTEIYLWAPPAPVKDLNELLQQQGEKALYEGLTSMRWEFIETMIKRGTQPMMLLRMIANTGRGKEVMRQQIKIDDPLEYALSVIQ